MQCPTCGAIAPAGTRFCERDGSRLIPQGDATVAVETAPGLPRCARCGFESFDEDGFCLSCGTLRDENRPDGPDHLEQAPLPELGGVTDRGIRHPWNEDSLALGAEEIRGAMAYVLVVCDGVSSSQHAQDASSAAANTARDVLLEALRADSDRAEAMRDAVRKAHSAVCAVPWTEKDAKDPPGTTFVAATVEGNHVNLGWVGDSRAYWIGTDSAALVSRDHSWVNEMVDSGRLSLEEAMKAPERNAITRCLGLLDNEDPNHSPEPSISAFDLPADAWLLLCSDGLWKYAPEASSLAGLVRAALPLPPVDIARRLVEFANRQGGSDNITAALLQPRGEAPQAVS